ncbi:YheC/YheD family protein [Paenibacillus mucilaginosus]|uniref:YheD n=1 Tax=Paenibacillus mucilaginosus (strain KNP414) TaxID=1036673 RepID=F8FHB9_PAEMK|nr:YheC/YheD family protein [Paenibacillus mucilaginosus]AEI39821.1 YheD [Paenibacillus mucilaginosus KNP414]MCG7217870.1 YheC/YheD family protein [Paenibacillus mucilaginosus]WDM29102.1 YheC/YheD family protein [Paenibacillus mucilaginosus]
MKRTKVKIQIQSSGLSSDGSVVMLSEAVAKKWKIPFQQTLQLRFGSSRQDVRVVPLSQAGALRISGALASRWGLFKDDQLCLQYKSSSRTLVLGPLIGVMVSRVHPGSLDKMFGVNTAFCRELTDACRLYGASVFFSTPDDLQGQGDTVKGWRYTGTWERMTFPVPNVLYNRLTSRKLENLENVQQFVGHAKTRYNAVMFNEKYLNKTEVFDALRKETGLGTYLPESHLLRSFTMLKSMCTKHPTVFLKPITGSLGKGIIRVRRQPEGSYLCHFTSLNGARKQSFSTLTQLFNTIAGKVKTQKYQIQQGLNLLTVGGRPVDFRALVQRGDTGQWGITSIVARIAGSQHFVSNLARGGSLSTVKDALARSGSAASSGGLPKLRRAALSIAKGIESQVPGHFAELGIDLAIDTAGRVWLLEVNSKPSKEDNTPLDTERKIRPSVKGLVQYARFAAKF